MVVIMVGWFLLSMWPPIVLLLVGWSSVDVFLLVVLWTPVLLISTPISLLSSLLKVAAVLLETASAVISSVIASVGSTIVSLVSISILRGTSGIVCLLEPLSRSWAVLK